MPEDFLLELRDATVVRSGRRVLDRLNLRLPVGRHTAILGPNGSGKSTLIKLVTRELYPLQNGHKSPIRILGQERWDVSELRSRLGIVSPDLEQLIHAGDSTTGLDVVLSGFFGATAVYSHSHITQEMRIRAAAGLQLMGANYLAGRPVNEMSSGEARRMLIARALVVNPESLILDEPTAGLDLVARRDFLNRLTDIARGGTTLVMITHHVEEIIPEIDWIILMKEGSVAVEGPKHETLTAANLSTVFNKKLTLSNSAGYFCCNLEI